MRIQCKRFLNLLQIANIKRVGFLPEDETYAAISSTLKT